tara:strand:- start:302 stop:781 length:480 start_codon:yes stop_codon:yes gene_type:complete
MQASWIFKPKYGIEIVRTVLNCFTDEFLDWRSNGIDFSFVPATKEGWYTLEAFIDSSSCEYYTETCFVDTPISSEHLANDMFVLLVDAGVAYRHHDKDEDSFYYLEDVDITEVLSALSEDGTSVFSPVGSRCYIYPVGDTKKTPRHVDMLDALLTLEAA